MGTNLKFVKVLDINAVPKYLFEQVKPKDFDVDALYEWAPILLDNPLNLVGAFINAENAVKGVLWGSYNPVNNTIVVHVLSIDKEYYGRGILNEADGITKKWKRKMGAKRVSIITTRPRAMERIGYKKSAAVMMEK